MLLHWIGVKDVASSVWSIGSNINVNTARYASSRYEEVMESFHGMIFLLIK